MTNGFFQDEKISEIRDRASILEVVSDYVSLKKTGRNHKGLCPFHSEKTPSFMVNEEKQIYHCFGCGEGGDVFTFLMKVGHFTFPQAVEELAKRYGIILPRRELSPSQKKEGAKRDLLFQINEMVSEYFHDLLTRKREGEEGRKYLAQREMGDEMVREYRLGYSLPRWDGLVQHLQAKKVSLDLARELGLVFPKKKEGWYDAFRGRVIFPIFDLHQRIVGFGGRVIGEGEPKYLNSPESIIYHKGETLYGLQAARRYVSEKDCAVVVEGYFDLLTLHRFGIKHSVATLGTALTSQHIRALKRYTKNLITVFDADAAGVQATLRSLPLFLEEEVVGKTILLPKGEDPDGYLRKGKVSDFEKRVTEAFPVIDFFFDRLMKTHEVKSIEGRVRIAQEGMALIRKIPDKIRRDFYVKALAERINVQESFLHEMLRTSPKERPKVEEGVKGQVLGKPFPKSEEMVIQLMVHYPNVTPKVLAEGVLKEFESSTLREAGEELGRLYQRKGRLPLTEVLECVKEDLRGKLCAYALQEHPLTEPQQEKILRDCVQKIREKQLKRDKEDLLRRIKEAEHRHGGEGLESLLMARQELEKVEKPLRD